ncbi:MAG: bifunctional serine/threonine-protein kinase/formylglycine-generating enzyme family protein [Pirellulaceae bacterium]
MSAIKSDSDPRIDALSAMERRDVICDDFEHRLRSGEQPLIERYVAQAPLEEQAILVGLLLEIELEHRRAIGQFPHREDYAKRLAAHAATVARVFQSFDHDPSHAPQRRWERAPASLRAGDTVRDYELLEVIGAGGMGEVYRARHRAMDRTVALKLLAPRGRCSGETVERFKQEVRFAGRLSHPNIITAYDAGEHAGAMFLVMEFAEGEDLGTLVKRRGPLPPALALECIRQAAQGLDYAHRQGVIHRDVKPGNLLLDTSGTIRVLDLGLARLESETSSVDSLTPESGCLGTIDFMSPEQASAPREAGVRCDIYSLGCTLYYLLTGRPTYEGASIVDRLLAHRELPIPELASRVRGASPSLQCLFSQLVAKAPDDRPSTMAEVVEQVEAELSRCMEDVEPRQQLALLVGCREEGAGTISLRDGGTLVDVSARPRSPRRLPTKTVLAVVAFGIGLLLLAGSLWRGEHARQAPTEASALVDIADRFEIEPPSIKSARTPSPPDRQPIAETKTEKAPQIATPREPSQPRIAGPEPTPPQFPFSAEQARGHQLAWANHRGVPVVEENSLGMMLALIPPGEFLMGSTPEEGEWVMRQQHSGRSQVHGEQPRHRVRISKPYWIGVHEVTVGQYSEFSGKRIPRMDVSRRFAKVDMIPRHPMLGVSWDDAVAFCDWLSEREQQRYRLPTEAEWEYACRAGSGDRWCFGDDKNGLKQYGWVTGHPLVPHPVGLKQANAFGLFDMYGNAAEWCHDRFGESYYQQSPVADPAGPPTGEFKVLRGGWWGSLNFETRSAARHYAPAGEVPRLPAKIGFRVVREMSEQSR